MDDDFNTAEAVAELFNLANEIGRGKKALAAQLKAPGRRARPAAARPAGVPAGRDRAPADKEIQDKIDARLAARKAKNYAEADRIRKELEAAGVILEDGPKGTTWRRA